MPFLAGVRIQNREWSIVNQGSFLLTIDRSPFTPRPPGRKNQKNPFFYQKKAILPPNLTETNQFYPKNCHYGFKANSRVDQDHQ